MCISLPVQLLFTKYSKCRFYAVFKRLIVEAKMNTKKAGFFSCQFCLFLFFTKNNNFSVFTLDFHCIFGVFQLFLDFFTFLHFCHS